LKQIPTQDSRKQRNLAATSFITFLLLTVVIINVSLLFASVRQARAAALIPMTTPSLPGVFISGPTNNSVHPWKAPLSITASVTDSDPNVTITRVEFYSGTTLLGTSMTAPYSIIWTAPQPGSYTLTAKAYDNYGDVVTSAPVTIFIAVQDPVPPTVTITSPANNTTYNAPATVMVAATASDVMGPLSKVDFYNGSTLLGTSTSAPYHFTWANVPAGTYILKAVATDAGSGVTGTSAPITIIVLPGPPPGICKVSYQLSSQWSGGFQTNLVITNTGMSKISGWVLKFTFPGDQKITNLWNGNYTQSGEQVTISNLSWNGTISPRGSLSLGFNGTWTSNNTNPASFTLNGQACN
jgi:hypothetical protein